MDIDKDIDGSCKDVGDCSTGDCCAEEACCGCGHDHEGAEVEDDKVEVNFFNYIASMGYQAMIFLGEVPNPITNKVDQNLRQAKFLIDTIALISEKTRGNLSEQEEQFVSGTLHELQMKYADVSKKGLII